MENPERRVLWMMTSAIWVFSAVLSGSLNCIHFASSLEMTNDGIKVFNGSSPAPLHHANKREVLCSTASQKNCKMSTEERGNGKVGILNLLNVSGVFEKKFHDLNRVVRAAASGPRPDIFNEPEAPKEPVRLSLTPTNLEGDAGVRLGGFLIDVLTTTGHVDVHLVTKGLIVEGLDTVANMMVSRFIQIEIWSDLYLFLSHLGPTEGYLSADQFIVYGASKDVVNIIHQRRAFMDVINTGITTWYYVVLDNEVSNQELANMLEEASISILLRPSLYRQEDWIAYTLLSPGDGTRFFQVVGKWTKTTGLQVNKPVFPKGSRNFFGRILTIGIVNKPRVLEMTIPKDSSSSVEMKGYSNVILKILQDTLNFTVQPREYFTWGHADQEGQWNGIIGDLIRKELHFSPMDFTPTKESREVIDFTTWVSDDPVVITSAAPQPEIRPWLLLEIYSPFFYLVLGLVLLSCGFILWSIMQFNMTFMPGLYPVSAKHSFREVIATSLQTIVSQCLIDLPSEFSSRLFLITVWFCSFILDAVYQGNITAFIAMPRFTATIDNHDQLSSNKSVIPVTEEYSTLYTMIVESDRASFQRLAERLETYGASFLDTGDFFEGIAVGRWAFVDSYSSAYGRALSYENERKRCKFHVSKESIIGGLDAWPFPRNSPVHAEISESLKWLRYFGIVERIKSKFYVSTCERTTGLNAVSGPNKMSTSMLQGIFYVVVIGWTFSLVILLLEIAYSFAKRCVGF